MGSGRRVSSLHMRSKSTSVVKHIASRRTTDILEALVATGLKAEPLPRLLRTMNDQKPVVVECRRTKCFALRAIVKSASENLTDCSSKADFKHSPSAFVGDFSVTALPQPSLFEIFSQHGLLQGIAL